MSKLDETVIGAAVFSDCGTYRYLLRREFAEGDGSCLFIMLNPSTATARENDPTIRRCMGFAQDWGYKELVVANLFALRSTDPKKLLDHADPVGPHNDYWLERLDRETTVTVAAWGAFPLAIERGKEVIERVPDIKCLGTTKKGQPKHPLYLPKDLTPVAISPEER